MPSYGTSLDQLIADIESSGNPSAPGGLYQQGAAFQSQFGSGQSGVNNFTSQALSANPNITTGDLYAEYNQGTGSPGSGATFANLPASVQNNFLQWGVSPNTPASQLVNSTPVSSPVSGNGGVVDPTDLGGFSGLSIPDQPGLSDASATSGSNLSQNPGYLASLTPGLSSYYAGGSGSTGSPITSGSGSASASGSGSPTASDVSSPSAMLNWLARNSQPAATNNMTGGASSTTGGLGSFLERILIVIIGIVIAGAAIFLFGSSQISHSLEKRI